MDNRFKVVGYLVPSATGRSYKIIFEGRFIGLVPRDALLNSLRARPMRVVEISRFIDDLFHEKPTAQKTLEVMPIADPDKIEEPRP